MEVDNEYGDDVQGTWIAETCEMTWAYICEEGHCGDGVIGPGEECDDGTSNSETCTTNCILKPTLP